MIRWTFLYCPFNKSLQLCQWFVLLVHRDFLLAVILLWVESFVFPPFLEFWPEEHFVYDVEQELWESCPGLMPFQLSLLSCMWAVALGRWSLWGLPNSPTFSLLRVVIFAFYVIIWLFKKIISGVEMPNNPYSPRLHLS